MSIRIFEHKSLRGASQSVNSDIADLKGGVDKPSSIQLSSANDAVLLFKLDRWRGGAHFLKGQQTVENLGSTRSGGRATFGNAIRSVRVKPFRLDLNINVVKRSNGDLPGRWKNEFKVRRDIEDMVRLVNKFYDGQKALLQLRIAQVRFQTSDRHFIMSKRPAFPREWKQSGTVDVVLAHRLKSGDIGRAPFPLRGQVVRVVAGTDKNAAFSTLSTLDMAGTLAHEIGHYLGLTHRSAGDNERNLMFATSERTIVAQFLSAFQIRCMHETLARSRRKDRH